MLADNVVDWLHICIQLVCSTHSIAFGHVEACSVASILLEHLLARLRCSVVWQAHLEQDQDLCSPLYCFAFLWTLLVWLRNATEVLVDALCRIWILLWNC